MQPPEFNALFENLTSRQREVLKGFLVGKTDEAIATTLYLEPATIRRHLANICKIFGLTNSAVGRSSHRDELIDLVARYRPELIPSERLKSYQLTHTKPEFPGDPLTIKSQFYMARPPIENRCQQEIQEPGALIRIRAARRMGKTSLLNRILFQARQLGQRTVRLSLHQADALVLTNIDTFLKWFAANITHQLGLPLSLETYWDAQHFGSINSCTIYFQSHILPQMPLGLVLGLDEVDSLFTQTPIAQGFFALLRSWHEEANTLEIWARLRLVVIHSTEVYIPLNLHQSPFNVGLPIRLTPMTLQQTCSLASAYSLAQADIGEQHLAILHQLLGGHPYLMQLAFYHLRQADISFSELLNTAATQSGIYESHLRHHWKVLQAHPDLMTSLKETIKSKTGIELNPLLTYKLESMGLIKLVGNQATISCDLYRQYFHDRVNS